MNAESAIEWLFSTQMFGIKLGLDGPRKLLKDYLAYPKRGVKVIQVAGTNGKGSTAAMIDSVARACGIRTGLFTSPHLVHFSERIRVSGQRIPDQAIASGVTSLKELVADWAHHPTFFELSLALAMRYFAQRECELIILETGMGGRLDATTAVPTDLAVITPIGLDHTQWLGDTLEKIAGEKAGIIRHEKPVIVSQQEPEAFQVIERQANEMRAPLHLVDEPLLGYALGLKGPHQKHNAALAVTALHVLGVELREPTVRQGLENTSWPGRFEVLEEGRITLDGAHNPHSALALAETWNQENGGKATLIFGAVESKDIRSVLATLSTLAERVIFVKVPTQRGLEVETLRDAWPKESTCDQAEAKDLADALELARASDSKILVAGSLFLIGAARAQLAGIPFQASEQ